tara:strand:- start:170 stop:643 length:474 start_codon:yes stop_codon:yes gene_type:complete
MNSISITIPQNEEGLLHQKNSPNIVARNAGLKFHKAIDYGKQDNYLFFENKSSKKILTPNDNNPMLDEIMDSMEFDKFKDKEAYNKDEFYVTLCTVAKRAKAFREMFMDRKPNFIKPIRPRVMKNLSTNKSISKINRHKSKITQLQTLESGLNSGSG